MLHKITHGAFDSELFGGLRFAVPGVRLRDRDQFFAQSQRFLQTSPITESCSQHDLWHR